MAGASPLSWPRSVGGWAGEPPRGPAETPIIVTVSVRSHQVGVISRPGRFGSGGVHQGKSLVGTSPGWPPRGHGAAAVRVGGAASGRWKGEGGQDGGDEAADGR